jgi:hypothetical protein
MSNSEALCDTMPRATICARSAQMIAYVKDIGCHTCRPIFSTSLQPRSDNERFSHGRPTYDDICAMISNVVLRVRRPSAACKLLRP